VAQQLLLRQRLGPNVTLRRTYVLINSI
jgi:hypothetical protein